MLHKLMISTTCLLAFAATAQAQEMKACDAETFAMVTTMVEEAKDVAADKKEMAMADLEKAKMAMTESKTEDCSKFLGMAADAVMKQ